ncbi:MAG: TonB-dependent receptor [Rhodocyclaceae bacterium]|nr:TonB-dependent receptor [Rhodocyclaceae bacterium]
MTHKAIARLGGLLCFLLSAWVSASPLAPTEQDYFSELPEVLTVTRLAQPLNETPGAVTILDRETIRRFGAREVIDVLRLVPGYLFAGVNGAHPIAAYHAPIDEFGARNLVFLDGRPLYNAFYVGDTFHGLMGVLVEDIERIEVLRGSNSAAYGANAMFGVINIVTRHAADTPGGLIVVHEGENGLRDAMARIGWGNDAASFRLSAGRREDEGWKGARDDRRIEQLHFRGDFRPAADQEAMLAAGIIDMALDAGRGTKGEPWRTTGWREFFLNGQWRWQWAAHEEIKLSAHFDEAENEDRSPYVPDPNVTLDYSGKSRKMGLELQHQRVFSPAWRAVWGLGFEHNEARSKPLFNREGAVVSNEARLFGNLEWRPHAQWLINAGGFLSHHNWLGEDFSPRLMANFHVTPEHTLRFGASRSTRSPNFFELAADQRFYPKNVLGLLAAGERMAALAAYFNIPYRLAYADGSLRPERLETLEAGYFGRLAPRLTLDVRAYLERMSEMVKKVAITLPGYVTPTVFPSTPPIPAGTPIPVASLANRNGFTTRGLEYQLRWKPFDEGELWLGQNFQEYVGHDPAVKPGANLPPHHATTLAWFQKLPANLDFALLFNHWSRMSWGGPEETLPVQRRLDLRLGLPFRVGATRGELALTGQAVEGSYPVWWARRGYEFERRAFATLRLEF